MSANGNNPPAFPGPSTSPGQFPMPVQHGMTLRDYFAAKALIAILSIKPDPNQDFDTYKAKIAEVCFLYADAMLEERNK
jgi:hypothetical protein